MITRPLLVVFLVIGCSVTDCLSQIRLPRIISDHVILQRDRELKLWGWSSANEKITLAFGTSSFSTQADANGSWELKLPAQKAGGPYDLMFSGEKNKVVLKDVLFGDVWVCSGQSNMEMLVNNVKDKYTDIVAKSSNPYIRHFTVPQKYDFKSAKEDLAGGEWKEANPVNVLQFSAVAYFFALEIYEKYKVPIGLVNASLGGSPAESWMSEDALQQFPQHLAEAKKFQNDELISEIENSDRERINKWYAALGENDQGISSKWKSENVATDDWYEMQIPGYWHDENRIKENGVVWFRKTFTTSRQISKKPGRVFLGRIVDQDSVFINGTFVGTTGYQYPQRRYNLKAGILREGTNIISIKVINQSGKGGFVPDKPYCIVVDSDTIDLRGAWKYKMGTAMEPLAGQTFIRWKPMGLYNAMIAPITRFPIKGVIWYQGESNVGRHDEYKKLFPALIQNWRSKWNDNFPFLFVQLANFLEAKPTPEESSWAALRQAQYETLRVPKTGMAVAIDIGDWNDIHPLDKRTVGKRLALNALKVAYGEKNIMSQGPKVAGSIFRDKYVDLEFKNAGAKLNTKDKPVIEHIAISADGKSFVWAKTEIKKNKVRVWHESVYNPTVVRYAWADNPATANLYNEEGLPASPFEVRKSK
jgi:sialate O-acetylesterase